MLGLDKTASRIVMVGATLVALIFVGLILAYCDARKTAREARGEQSRSEAQVSAGKGAIGVSDRQSAAERALSEQERRNQEEILNADNANESAGDAGDIGLRQLCERVSLYNDPACVRLRELDRPRTPK